MPSEPYYVGYKRLPLHVYRGTNENGDLFLVIGSNCEDAEATFFDDGGHYQRAFLFEQVPDEELLTIYYAAGDWNVGAPEWDVTLPAGGWARASETPRLLASTTTRE